MNTASAMVLTGSLFLSTQAAAAFQPGPTERAVGAERSAAVLALLDEHVEWLKRESPLLASGRGDERYNNRLRDESPAAYSRRLSEMKDRLARLSAIDRAFLGEADATDADLLRYELETAIEGSRFHTEQMPVDAREGPQINLPQMGDSLPFASARQYADFAARLEAVPALIDQHIEQMRAGLAAGRVPPRVVVRGTDAQALLLASEDMAETPSLSPFYAPFRGLPAGDASAERARAAIRDGIVPAYRRLGEFLRSDYIPACRESIGISQSVDGTAAYDFALQAHTTTTMTAEQVHALGLSEVARIRGEMFEVIARTDFPQRDGLEGDELFNAFVHYLRTDPQFYCATPEELLTGYRDICKRMDAELPRLFGMLPRLSYGVRETPAFAAPTATTAYYYRGSLAAGIPAYFMANTYRLDQRPRYEMTALALHEAVPGHHLQIALKEELEGVHPFRTYVDYTAFVEGWALYAERLGLEVGDTAVSGSAADSGGAGGRGFYADPYDDFGRLTYEMWRACRLVVDTGMHAKGWTRQQAIDFMLANTALSPLNIEREVDRYIAWPGQACAYKIGELKIRELRTRAETRLGTRFDRRAFHDAVLGSGPLPLPTLELRMTRWIDQQAKR